VGRTESLTSGSPRPATAVLRVLIVDDNQAVREGLSRLIGGARARSCLVTEAGTLAEALRILQVSSPHLVVLDVDLAGDDGLALLPLPNSRVLVLTSHADTVTRERARLLGANGFLNKDAPASELLEHLVQLTPTHSWGDVLPIFSGVSSAAGGGTPP
jgi:CheY-like chemotaxis protein